MKQTLVRYKTKLAKSQDNQQLIEGVFEELNAKSPQDVRYLALRLADGTFVHFVIRDTGDGTSPLNKLEAFQAFQSGLKERCIELPQAEDATIVGNYRMLDTQSGRRDP